MNLDNFLMNPHLLAMPSFPPGKTHDELREEYSLERIVDLSSNENPLGPSPLAMEAINRAAGGLNRYSIISAAADELRRQLAASLGPGFDEDNIILGNGSVDVLRMVAEVFLYGGGESIIRRNAFPLYEVLNTLYGGECIFVETNEDYSFDLRSMSDRTTDRTRLIFLTNPDNPSGMIFHQRELDAFMEQVPSSALVILDHAYQEYAESREFPDVTKYVLQGRNVIVTRTFSKIYGLAGMRIGYGIADKELIAYLGRSRVPFYTGSMAPEAAIAALADTDHVRRSRQVNAIGKEYLYREFDRLGLRYLPTEAYFILIVDLPGDTREIAEALLRQGVIVGLGHGFHFPRAIRVTVGKQADNERLVGALEVVLQQMGHNQLERLG